MPVPAFFGYCTTFAEERWRGNLVSDRCALFLKLVSFILLHVDLQPASPLACLQGPEPQGLKHYALKVGANGEITLSIAGCLLQVFFSAYCLKSINLQLNTYHGSLYSLLLHMLVSLQDAEHKNYRIHEDTRQLKLKTELCMQAMSGLGNALSKCHITHEVSVKQCL